MSAPEIISRDEAKARGLKRFYTGQPCIHGHIDERCVSNWFCMECGRIKSKKWGRENPKIRFERHRKWVLLNPSKTREYKRRDYWKNREKLLERSKKYAAKNPEKARLRVKVWKRENPAKRRINDRKYYAKHKEEILAKGKLAFREYYYDGPKNPTSTGEKLWLIKNKVQLRNLKRCLKNRHREQSPSSQAET